MHVLADRFRDLVVRVGVHVLRVDQIGPLGVFMELAAEAADDDPRIDDGRTGNPAGLDSLPQRGVGVQTAVAQIALEGESMVEQRERVAGALERAVRGRVGNEHLKEWRGVEHAVAERRRAAVKRHGLDQRHRQMVVRFDEAGQDGQVRQIDHLRPWRNRDVRADCGDLAVLDDDGLVCRRRYRFGVNQASGFDRDRRGRRGLRRNALLLRRERQNERQQRSSERRRSPHQHLLRGSVRSPVFIHKITTARHQFGRRVFVLFVADRGLEIHLEPSCCCRFGNSACGWPNCDDCRLPWKS